eukprot:Nitzschia sp. Nitz4//scaffold92_size79448//43924//45019//NITZ4_005394-RA/size79448-augustus-gene-0.24-mRNA-1//1//CDS//3329560195//5064//frame0
MKVLVLAKSRGNHTTSTTNHPKSLLHSNQNTMERLLHADTNGTVDDVFFDSAPTPPTSDEVVELDSYLTRSLLACFFVAVICCTLPVCCAFRRRLQNQARTQPSSSSPALANNGSSAFAEIEEQAGKTPIVGRKEILTNMLKATTMTIPPCYGSKNNDTKSLNPDSDHHSETGHTVDSDTKTLEDLNEEVQPMPPIDSVDLELGCCKFGSGDDDTGVPLPVDAPNGNRRVAGGCAICLCPYDAGDEITWSDGETCKHAFHSECILAWLMKEQEPRCPCCRQMFCDIEHHPKAAEELTKQATFALHGGTPFLFADEENQQIDINSSAAEDEPHVEQTETDE